MHPAIPRLGFNGESAVTIDWAGQATRGVVVRLPVGFIADDLKEPGVWSKVQPSHAKTLRPWDRLTLISYDQTWLAEAIVSHATESAASLAGVRIVQTPQGAVLLFRDDQYAVKWNGVGYCVERISDGVRMSQTVATPQMAERDLRNLYPKTVGAA